MYRPAINERIDIHESEHERQKQEAARREKAEEDEAYEMDINALGWAENAIDLWIPAKYPPVKDGEYLTLRNVENDKRITINIFENGKWLFNGIWKVTAWLPMPLWE